MAKEVLAAELASRPEFTSDLGGAAGDALPAELKRRNLKGFDVTLKLVSLTHEPKPPRPGGRLKQLAVGAKVSVFGTTIPEAKLAFGGDGEAMVEAEIVERRIAEETTTPRSGRAGAGGSAGGRSGGGQAGPDPVQALQREQTAEKARAPSRTEPGGPLGQFPGIIPSTMSMTGSFPSIRSAVTRPGAVRQAHRCQLGPRCSWRWPWRLACRKSVPETSPTAAQALPALEVTAEGKWLYTYADDAGRFVTTDDGSKVPGRARRLVRVLDPGQAGRPRGRI